MEIQQLRYFLAVAEEGNLTRASKKLNTVQSNTTAKLKQLEHELGHQLFIRSKKGMKLTERGLSLLPFARSMIEIESNIKRDMESDIEPVGILGLGCLDTFIRIYLRDIVPKFVSSYTRVDLEISTGFTPLLFQKLDNGSLDLAGVVGEVNEEKYEIIHQWSEKMVLISKKKPRADTPLLILGKECFFGQTLQEYFNHTRKVLQIASIESILTCVESGIGISLLPKKLVPKELSTIVSKRLSEPCTYSIIRKRERPWSASEKVFLQMLKNKEL